MSRDWHYFGKGLPYLQENGWPGHLIVLEGSDCAGRSTQIAMLRTWLEQEGYAVAETGLRRSGLAGRMISEAKEGTELGRTTRSLLYITDLADQLESVMIPALRAGFVVLSDRYVFSLMARDMVRGADPAWLQELMGFAVVPDLVIYLRTTPEERLHRALARHGALDYWESGLDLGLAADRYTSFLRYQGQLQDAYDQLSKQYGFAQVDGSQSVRQVQEQIRNLVGRALDHEVLEEE